MTLRSSFPGGLLALSLLVVPAAAHATTVARVEKVAKAEQLEKPSSAKPARRAKPKARAADDAGKPRGFVEMFVAGIVPTPGGQSLILVCPDEQVMLPLGIGSSEALSIHGRLERHPFPRPLTHDLLDHIVAGLGGTIVKVQIDDMRGEVFVGTVFVKANDRVFSVDARPSDAVALAIGSRAPIFVARPVLDRAAIHPGDAPPGSDDDAPNRSDNPHQRHGPPATYSL